MVLPKYRISSKFLILLLAQGFDDMVNLKLLNTRSALFT